MSDLTPQQTEAVRRALRAARHDAPVPDQVAARLDDRLAELVAERASLAGHALVTDRDPLVETTSVVEPVDATVVPLRRQRWPALLAAAAAVTAIGLAGTQLIDRGGQGDSPTSAESAGSADDDVPPVAGPETNSYDSVDGVDRLRNELGTTPALVPALTAADFDRLTEVGYRRVRPVPLLRDTTSALTDNRSLREDQDGRVDEKELNGARSATKATGPWEALASGAHLAPCGAAVPADLLDEATFYRARHEGRPVLLVVLPGPEVTAYPCFGGEPTPVPLD